MLTTNIEIRKNKKFTTAVLGCFLRLPLTSNNLALASLIAKLQMNASRDYPSIMEQQQKLTELYDLELDIMPQLFGKEIILSYYANFVEPSEILDPDYTYEKIIETISQIIKFPYYDHNTWLGYAQQQLREDYDELMGQPANYAIERFFRLWYRDQPEYADSFMGSIEKIENATYDDVDNFVSYMRSRPITVLGMARDNNQVTKLVNQYFRGAGIIKKFEVDDLTIPAQDNPIEKTEEQDNAQAQLLMGFGFKQNITYQGQISGLLLSQYLAGDQSSKLFSQIREELGAAYDVEASSFANNNLFLINAGLDPDKIGDAKRIVFNEMQKIADGEVDDSLFKKAKKSLERSTKIGLDGQNWQLGQALRGALFPDYVNFDRAAAIKKATPHQLVDFVKNLFFNESYVLK